MFREYQHEYQHLSLDELKPIAGSRNIWDYENKSKKDLIKALRELKPKIGINKRKLEEIRKDFNELRHQFSKKEIDEDRKSFYDIKNYRYISSSEIQEARENLNELEKGLKCHGDIDSVDYDDLDNYDDNYDFTNDDECRKIGSIRRLFKEFDKYFYKPIRDDYDFGGRNNSHIEYTSKGGRYENLSPEEYFKMIRPYLGDLINNHKPTEELNNEEEDNSDIERGEWKVQLVIQNNCISVKHFEEIITIYSASNPLEVFMGSNTNDFINRLFDTTSNTTIIETSGERGSEFIHESVA